MTIFKQNADPTRSLEQIRLTCPLLRTRLIPVEPDTTVQRLQQKVELQLQKGPHEWYNAQGEQLVCEGANQSWRTPTSRPTSRRARLRCGRARSSWQWRARIPRRKRARFPCGEPHPLPATRGNL